ncbi:MAG: lytic transglycosylase domain-containing protein [Nitrosomonas sp.]
MHLLICAILLILFSNPLTANQQRYEYESASTQTISFHEISDQAVSYIEYAAIADNIAWLTIMSQRMEKFIPNSIERDEFLRTVYYESKRAGLDPQIVLSVIQVESRFNKYAISSAGARGYMQVMPFWVDVIGQEEHNLFHLRVNLRYGCTILRHYLDIEKGDYFRALGRYNGSLGVATYPQLVFDKWSAQWQYTFPSSHRQLASQ